MNPEPSSKPKLPKKLLIIACAIFATGMVVGVSMSHGSIPSSLPLFSPTKDSIREQFMSQMREQASQQAESLTGGNHVLEKVVVNKCEATQDSIFVDYSLIRKGSQPTGGTMDFFRSEFGYFICNETAESGDRVVSKYRIAIK